MAAAKARIGGAWSAYDPNIVLSPAIGFEFVAGGSLFTASSLLWSLGRSAFENVVEGGKIVAMNRFAEAGYRASVDDYSATVLQEVQEGMSSMSYLGKAADESVAVPRSADHVRSVATERYRDGLAKYPDVIDAQQARLTQRRLNTTIRGEQLAQNVYLIKALGGADGTRPRLRERRGCFRGRWPRPCVVKRPETRRYPRVAETRKRLSAALSPSR